MDFENLVNSAIDEMDDISQYYCYKAIAPEEIDRIKAELIACHERGETLLPLVGDDPFGGILPDTRPQASELEEAAAIAAKIVPLALLGVITAYHRQVSKETALSIINGAQALASTPGNSWIFNPIDAFPGYRVSIDSFVRDWNAANPEQKAISIANATPIATRRKAVGMTQSALAAALGTDQRSVSRWENGGVEPRASVLVKMADILACDVKDLV